MEIQAGSTTQAPAPHVPLWDLAWRSTPNGNYASQRKFSSQPSVIRNIQVPFGRRCWQSGQPRRASHQRVHLLRSKLSPPEPLPCFLTLTPSPSSQSLYLSHPLLPPSLPLLDQPPANPRAFLSLSIFFCTLYRCFASHPRHNHFKRRLCSKCLPLTSPNHCTPGMIRPKCNTR